MGKETDPFDEEAFLKTLPPEQRKEFEPGVKYIDASKPLKRPQRERYAQLLFAGTGQTDAYEMAGFSRDTSAATRMARQPDVAARLEWLFEEQLRKTMEESARAYSACIYDQAQAMIEAEMVRSMAMKLGRASAAINAVRTKALLSGLIKRDDDAMMREAPERMTIERIAEMKGEFERAADAAEARLRGVRPGSGPDQTPAGDGDSTRH